MAGEHEERRLGGAIVISTGIGHQQVAVSAEARPCGSVISHNDAL